MLWNMRIVFLCRLGLLNPRGLRLETHKRAKRRRGRTGRRVTNQTHHRKQPPRPKEKDVWTCTRESRDAVTHISEESFKCQLCRLSTLTEFLLFALLELLELPVRCMKPMLYHFLDFSNELSCGFGGLFGLFSGCGCCAPSFVSHFSTGCLSAHSSTDGAAFSASLTPADSDWGTSTSPIIFDRIFLSGFALLSLDSMGSLSRRTPHHKGPRVLLSLILPLLINSAGSTRHWSYLNRSVLVPFLCEIFFFFDLWLRQIPAIKKEQTRIFSENFEIDSNFNSIFNSIKTVYTAKLDRLTTILTRSQFKSIFHSPTIW